MAAKKDKQPVTVQKKEQSPALAHYSLTPTTTTTSLAPQITSPSILIPSSTSSLPQTLPPIPTKPPPAALKPPHALYTTKVSKDKGSLHGKLLKAGNTKVAIPKTTKVATISLGNKTNPATTSSMTTYLLSAGSLNIEQLLQAHLQQKSGGGIQLFTTTSPSLPSSSSSPSPVTLSQAKGVAGGQGLQGVKILSKTTAAPPPKSQQAVATVPSKSKASGLTAVPAVVQGYSKVTPVVSQPRLLAKVAPTTTKVISAVPQPGLSTNLQSSPPPATSMEKSAALTSAQTAALEIGKLESVVSKIVGSLGKQQQQQRPPLSLRVSKAASPLSSPAEDPSSSINRLHLTKKMAISSPKVIFPGQGDSSQAGESGPRYVSGGVVKVAPSSSETVKTATPSSVLTPIGGMEREMGVVERASVSSTTRTPPPLTVGGSEDSITPPLSTGIFGPPNVTSVGGHHVPPTKMPPPLLAGKPINSLAGVATPSPRLPSNSATGSVSMVPDTPPTFLSTPTPPLSLNHQSAGGPKFNSGGLGLDNEDPCLSPLKSPVEQILEEHSYLSTSS